MAQTTYSTAEFPPPPTESGAGQAQDLSLSEMNVNQGAPTQHMLNQEAYYPPPPAQPYPQTQTAPMYHEQFQQQNFPRGPMAQSAYAQAPPLPQRPYQDTAAVYVPQSGASVPSTGNLNTWQPPPKRRSQDFGADDPSNPIHYTRDPHKLTAYLVPFPTPHLKGVDPAQVPLRFLIYTPPPPPLSKPVEGEKEGKLHMVQRKWQEEVRGAKTSTAKTASWQGVKSKATRGISKAMQYTTSSNLDFLGRVSGNKSDSEGDRHANDGHPEGETTHKTVGVEEMVLVYPPTMNLNGQQMREEFVNTMLRTKSKAQRDAIIATGLMPVAYGIDILATLVWPFGGLGEVDTVWAYKSLRGAKTARNVTKRLTSSSSGDHEKDTLHLTFTPSPRLELLRRYLASECNKADPKLFPEYVSAPTESDVLHAVGWNPSSASGTSGTTTSTEPVKNWEDDQWELQEVKEDFKTVMKKGAREWRKWCEAFGKDPEKALKK